MSSNEPPAPPPHQTTPPPHEATPPPQHYTNEFLSPLHNAQAPQQPHGYRRRTVRSKTEPRPPADSKKKQMLLPGITGAKAEERTLRLRSLYEQKSKLFRRLEFVNKRLAKARLEMSQVAHPPQPTRQPHSKSHGNSRNRQYLLDLPRQPDSTSSLAKNRQVLSFIQKMHEESVKRDLTRYQRSQKAVAGELSHVCLECSRAKCQADALQRVLRDSRAAP